MKKTNNSNPLKFFNDNKAMAYKKAGGAMKDFKKSLPKAQDGSISGMGRMATNDAAFEAMNPNQALQEVAESLQQNQRLNSVQSQAARLKDNEIFKMNNAYPQWRSTPEGGLIPIKQKKGGAVKRKK
jgi:hypothetical protein